MSTPAERYRVTYSERVRNALRATVASAQSHTTAQQILAAIEEIDRRLQVYPQFGQPLSDLHLKSGQLWIAVVAPLVVKYAIIEECREVWVGVPMLLMSGSGG